MVFILQDFRNHLMSDKHQNNASQFVPKSEPDEAPKPSIDFKVTFKDGEPVVDESLVVLDWCKYLTTNYLSVGCAKSHLCQKAFLIKTVP